MKITVDASGPAAPAPDLLRRRRDDPHREPGPRAPWARPRPLLKRHARNTDLGGVLHTSVEEMSNHDIYLETRGAAEGPADMVEGLCAGGVIAFDMACRSAGGGQGGSSRGASGCCGPGPTEGWRRCRARGSAAIEPCGEWPDARSLMILGQKVRKHHPDQVEQRTTRVTTPTKVSLLREPRKRGTPPPALLKDLSSCTLTESPRSVTSREIQRQAAAVQGHQAARWSVAGRFRRTGAIETIADPLPGWSNRSTDGIEVVEVPGGDSSTPAASQRHGAGRGAAAAHQSNEGGRRVRRGSIW